MVVLTIDWLLEMCHVGVLLNWYVSHNNHSSIQQPCHITSILFGVSLQYCSIPRRMLCNHLLDNTCNLLLFKYCTSVCYWGEPERAPHFREAWAFCLIYIVLSLLLLWYVRHSVYSKKSTQTISNNVYACAFHARGKLSEHGFDACSNASARDSVENRKERLRQVRERERSRRASDIRPCTANLSQDGKTHIHIHV